VGLSADAEDYRSNSSWSRSTECLHSIISIFNILTRCKNVCLFVGSPQLETTEY